MAVAAGLTLLTGGCATEWVRFSDHADPLDESRWRCRAQANEKWPEKMDVVESTEYVEVLTVCKQGETCDVDGKYKKMLMPRTERHTVDVNAKQNYEHFMGCMGGRRLDTENPLVWPQMIIVGRLGGWQ